MKTIWLWGEVWKVALALLAAAAVAFGMSTLLNLGMVGSLVMGLTIGIPTGSIATLMWPFVRFE